MAKQGKKFHSCLLSLVLGIVVLSVLWLGLGELARRIANKYLPDLLGTDVQIGRIEVSPFNGWIAAESVTLGQPGGFREGLLANIPYATVDIDMRALLKRKLVVEQVTIDNAICTVERSTNKIFNVHALFPAPATTNLVTPHAPATPAAAPPPILIRRVEIRNASVVYVDAALSTTPLEVHVTRLNGVASNVVIDTTREDETELPATLWATAQIVQRGQDAMVGVGARVAAVGLDIPTFNAVGRLTGLELETVRAVLPPGTEQALGGDCLDARTSLSISPDMLDIHTDLLTSANKLSLSVGGTPTAPTLDGGNIMLLLLARTGGGVGGVAMNLGKGTAKAADTAIDTGVMAVKGIGKTLSSFMGGVLTAAKGIVTADTKTIGQGLEHATAGSASNIVQTVKDTGKTLANGIVETGSTATGEKGAAKWRATRGSRWTATWAAVPAQLAAMPFPGKGKDQVIAQPKTPAADTSASTTNIVHDAASTPATNAIVTNTQASVEAAEPTEGPSPRATEELLQD
jgi:hypothetical protein